jgi:hypothetical protein
MLNATLFFIKAAKIYVQYVLKKVSLQQPLQGLKLGSPKNNINVRHSQYCGSGSGRIRNFQQNLNPETDPEKIVPDPGSFGS